jgi:hypothetical protein
VPGHPKSVTNFGIMHSAHLIESLSPVQKTDDNNEYGPKAMITNQKSFKPIFRIEYQRNIVMLTRQEEERLVIDLYNQNKTYREIAKEVRICPRDIGTILKKASGEREEDQNKGQSSLLSPSTQAYRLFSESKTPIEVAIALNLSESETTKYYEEYLNLKQMHELRMVYEETGPDIMHFLKLYRLSKDAHMNPEHVVRLLQTSNGYLPMLELKIKKLTKEVDRLESEKQKLKEVGNQIRALTNVSQKYGDEITNLEKEKRRLETIVKIFRNSNEYKKIKQIAEGEVNKVLSKSKDLLNLAIFSVIESIIRDPVRFNLLVSQYGDRHQKASRSFIDLCRALVLDEAQKLFDVMVRDLTDKIINDAALRIHPQTA